MNTYIVLLRGINVVGHNMIPMPGLKQLCESIGFSRVTTYIQSGNVVLSSRKTDVDAISKAIRDALEKRFGFRVAVLTRQPSDLERIIKKYPFAAQDVLDGSRFFVNFLSSRPAPALVKGLAAKAPKTADRFTLAGTEIYIHCPNGYGKTPLSNTFFEKHLKVVGTVRNWNTVSTLLDMCQKME